METKIGVPLRMGDEGNLAFPEKTSKISFMLSILPPAVAELSGRRKIAVSGGSLG